MKENVHRGAHTLIGLMFAPCSFGNNVLITERWD